MSGRVCVRDVYIYIYIWIYLSYVFAIARRRLFARGALAFKRVLVYIIYMRRRAEVIYCVVDAVARGAAAVAERL